MLTLRSCCLEERTEIRVTKPFDVWKVRGRQMLIGREGGGGLEGGGGCERERDGVQNESDSASASEGAGNWKPGD
eukprot:6193398-Pleurochrysis_carterae.AAC.5